MDWHLTSGLTDVPLEDPEMQAVAVQAYAQRKLDQMHDDGLSPAHVDIVDGDGVTHRVPAVQLHDNRLP